eukprot:c25650_g1_i1 orf=323-943(+)
MEETKRPNYVVDGKNAHENVTHILREIVHGILSNRDGVTGSQSYAQRTKRVFHEKAPQLKAACRHTLSDIVRWTKEGGQWRAFLVTTVAIVLLLVLTGFVVFMLFFAVATANAVAIGFLGSLALVGAFVALFFTSLTTIYIGALVGAVFSISTITFFSICAALTIAGWIGFLWVLWQGFRKVVGLIEGFLVTIVSGTTALSAGKVK